MVVLHYSFPIFWRKIKFISHLEVKRQIFWFCVVKFAMDSSSIIWNNLNIYQAPPLQIDLQFCNFKSSKTKTMALPKSSRLRKKSTKCQVTIQRNIIMNLWNFKQTSNFSSAVEQAKMQDASAKRAPTSSARPRPNQFSQLAWSGLLGKISTSQ